MKLEAPLTAELVALNDWRYYAHMDGFQAAIFHLQIGWPPVLIVKVLGVGFRAEVRWGDGR